MDYILHIGILICIYAVLAQSLNLIFGFTGLLSLMQAVFYGIGAYSVAILTSQAYQLPFAVSMLIGITVNVTLSYFIALLSNRLRDLYFGLATLAIQIIFYSIIYNWESLTKGSYGISGIQMPYIQGNFGFFGLGVVLLVLCWTFLSWFQKTALCRMIQGVRDDHLAVVAIGKNPFKFKLISLVISSFWATLSGALYAAYMTYIDPSSFTLDESILLLCVLLVGGSGNIVGPIVGAVFYTVLPEILRIIQLPNAVAANIKVILFGLILILVVRYRPSGFVGSYTLGK